MLAVSLLRRLLPARFDAQVQAAARLGAAVPCSDWVREEQHGAHRWEADGHRYACPGYRPLDDGAVPTWDFNWRQPGTPLCVGDVVTGADFQDIRSDGPRWVA